MCDQTTQPKKYVNVNSVVFCSVAAKIQHTADAMDILFSLHEPKLLCKQLKKRKENIQLILGRLHHWLYSH